jgi:hypothetical protein
MEIRLFKPHDDISQKVLRNINLSFGQASFKNAIIRQFCPTGADGGQTRADTQVCPCQIPA